MMHLARAAQVFTLFFGRYKRKGLSGLGMLGLLGTNMAPDALAQVPAFAFTQRRRHKYFFFAQYFRR